MEKAAINETPDALDVLCENAKHMVVSGDYKKCYELVSKFMSSYPDAPQPHNLIGILYEKEGCHVEAMKHFRAAVALDPTYGPANQNLDTYGTFYSTGRCAFSEADCFPEPENIIYSVPSSGFMVRRSI